MQGLAQERSATAKLNCLKFMGTRRTEYLSELSAGDPSALLRWLDESGVALYFLSECEREGACNQLPEVVAAELNARRVRNRTRVEAQLANFGSMVTALREREVVFAVQKGFSLVPEFCAHPYLRHQIEVDLLVQAHEYERAIHALEAVGFREEGREEFGEVRLISGESYTPTPRDDIYAVPRQNRIELHYAAIEDRYESGHSAPFDWIGELEETVVEGIRFYRLRTAQAFLSHVLHAYRHMSGGWTRASWLWEILYCARNGSRQFWDEVLDMLAAMPALQEPVAAMLRSVEVFFAVDLRFAERDALFSRIPKRVERFLSKDLATACALLDFPGAVWPTQLAFRGVSIPSALLRALRRRLRHPLSYFLGVAGKLNLQQDLSRVLTMLTSSSPSQKDDGSVTSI